jgi:hypothetical protein
MLLLRREDARDWVLDAAAEDATHTLDARVCDKCGKVLSICIFLITQIDSAAPAAHLC